MNNNIFNLHLDAQFGMDFLTAAKDAKRLSQTLNVGVIFDFNGVAVVISQTSDIDNAYENFKMEQTRSNKISGYRVVG